MKTILNITIMAILVFAVNLVLAQSDAEGCNDHPFFNRLSNYVIYDCIENYNEYEFMMGEDKTETLEGTLSHILYSYDGPFGPNLPSRLQVLKNYEQAILKMGGKKIYSRTKSDGGWTGGTFHLQKDGQEYWVGIYDLINDPVDQFSFYLLTMEGMEQEIEANEMFEQLNSGKSLTLYINFETGKTAIKTESQSILDELFTMMHENPSLAITIEGHTDNAGSKTSNQTLSEHRAESVKRVLMDKGIGNDRIKTIGYGQDLPIADNETTEGQAKNRRVEIKKM